MTPTTVSFTGILPVLFRRKRLLFVCAVSMAVVAFSVSKILPLGYSSEGSLIIDNRPTGGSESSSSQTVLTEVDYLQSKGLIMAAVEKYNLDTLPGLQPTWRLPDSIKQPVSSTFTNILKAWHSFSGATASQYSERDQVVTFIQKHLTVAAKEKSYVISISFEAGTPQAAALVANAIMVTYLHGIEAAKQNRIEQAGKLTDEQIVSYQQQVADAERRVTDYVQTHSLPQVQGSQTAAVELSNAQQQLVLARQDLAQKQAALDSVNRTTVSGTMEAIGSKSIVNLTDKITGIQAQLAVMSQFDPRREQLQTLLNSMKGQLATERANVYDSLNRDVIVARAHLKAIESLNEQLKATAQDTNVADTSLKQLMADLDARRQLYVSFVTQAGQARIAAIQAPTAHQLFTALPPDRPAHAFGMLSIILGMMMGAIGSASYVILRAMLRTKIDTAEEMTVIAGLPVVGSLPSLHKSERRVPLHTAPQMAETFRSIWLSMRPQNGEGVAMLVTSSEIGEGKTTIATSLAQRFADDDFRVLLIDTDLRHPRLSSLMKAIGDYNLQAVINGEVPLHKAVRMIQPNLDCLTTVVSNNPPRILASRQFALLLKEATATYDFVILDSAPTLHVIDPVILGALCRYILYVVQSGRWPSELIAEGIRRFSEEDRPKVRTMLNRVPRHQLNRRDYYGGYVSP